MKIRESFKDWSHDIKNDPGDKLRFLAFRDFCFDLLEEEFGRIPQGEKIDPRFVKGVLTHTEKIPLL